MSLQETVRVSFYVKRFEKAQIHFSFMITSEQVNMFKGAEDPLEGVTEGLYGAMKNIIRHF